ncbi:MAG: hypothetical protein H0Z37_07670 [Firmicutes bacterium]|nr:hypothetical protein [Bacillota bacterium]
MRMYSVFLRSSLAFIIFILVTTVSRAAPRAVEGVLDLADWDFQRDGIVALNGEWEFYGGLFLPPDALDASSLPRTPRLIPVPGSWNGYQDQSGAPMGSDGFATYRLKILLPRTVADSRNPTKDELAIFVPYVNTSYELWVDGDLLAANGRLARSRPEEKPQFRPEIARFRPADRHVDLVLHVSNFHFREGGIPRRLELGTADQIALKQRRLEVTGATLFGANLIMAIFFAGIYALRRENRADGYFSLFLLSIALRMLVTGDHILARVTTELPWEMALKIEYLMDFVSPTIFLFYLRALFPEDVSTLIGRCWTAVAILGGAAVLVLPGRLSSRIIPPYLLLFAAILLYFVYVSFRAVARGRPDSRLFLGGIVATIVASLVTLLRYTGIAAVAELIPMGIFVLVLSQCLFLAVRSARTYQQALTLATENARMLAKTEWQLKKLKEYRRLMTLREEHLRRRIAETLHGRTQGRLFTAIRRIDQAERAMSHDIAAAGAYLTDAKQLLDQVREDDIRSVGRQLHPAAVGAGIVAAIESLLDTFEESYRVHFDVDPDVEAMDQAETGGFHYDLRLGVYRIVEEGLNNISRHAKAQRIRLSLAITHRDSGNYLELTLADDGVGFDPKSPSSGLGLQTIDARVSDLGGHWTLTGSPGKGTTLRVSIPLKPDQPEHPRESRTA